MSQIGKKSKSLLILDLNGVLGYMTHNYTKVGSMGIYNRNHNEFFECKPNFVDKNTAIWERPSLHKIKFDTLVRNKQLYDIGIWSSMGQEDTAMMVDKIFGRYLSQ